MPSTNQTITATKSAVAAWRERGFARLASLSPGEIGALGVCLDDLLDLGLGDDDICARLEAFCFDEGIDQRVAYTIVHHNHCSVEIR